MKKQATTAKRATKDLEAWKDRDVKGGNLASSVQKKLNDTNQSVIGKI